MLINPTLATQHARRVCVVGVPLWWYVTSNGTAVAAQAVTEVSSAASIVNLSPAAIKQALAEFGAQDPSYKQFLQLRENHGLPKHLGTLLQLLSLTDDPLTIEADIMTCRWGPAGSHRVLKGPMLGSCCPFL
jgi:hypothetical protein